MEDSKGKLVIINELPYETLGLYSLFRKCWKEIEKVEKPDYSLRSYVKSNKIGVYNLKNIRKLGKKGIPKNSRAHNYHILFTNVKSGCCMRMSGWSYYNFLKMRLGICGDMDLVNSCNDLENMARFIIHEGYHTLGLTHREMRSMSLGYNRSTEFYRGDVCNLYSLDFAYDVNIKRRDTCERVVKVYNV